MKVAGVALGVVEPLEPRRLLAIIYVDVNAHATAPDGGTWQTAYADLQQGILAAGPGSEIHVADGTYRPTSANDRTATFQLKDSVTILGGYAGFGAGNPDARDTVNTPTILSGDIGTAGSNTDNSYHVVTGNGTDSTAVLDGVTITGGAADGTGDSGSFNGGGITIQAGSPTINNCIITANSATPSGGFALFNHGGGLYVSGASSPRISNCVFSGNSLAGGNGGGIYDAGSSATYINCLISGNTSNLAAGIWIEQGSGSLINCTVTNNTATGTCGGLTTEGGTETFTSCIIYGNTGASSADFRSISTTANITYSDIGGGFSGTGNINVNPFFVNPAGANFQIQPNSLCINAGNPAALPSGDITDLAGNPRVAFGNVDMGAYESTARRSILVDASATGANNGSSWTDAYTDLAPALAAAPSGVNILVAKGTYNHFASQSGTVTYLLKSGVAVYGGYQGGSVNPFSRDVVANATILDGQFIQAHVVTAQSDAAGTILDGFEIENGYGPDATPSFGAGLLIQNANVTINNCEFVNDYASGDGSIYGGGVYSSDTGSASASITNCTFINCTADYGGAIANSGLLSVSGCTFTSNTAFQFGGAITSSFGAVTVTNCSFSKNTAFDAGGAIYAVAGSSTGSTSLIVTGSSFTGNTATSVSSHGFGVNAAGGAIYSDANTTTLVNDSFSLNSAYSYGAAAVFGPFMNFTETVTNCIFWGDTGTGGSDPETNADATYSDLTTQFPDTGDINLNPLFVDAAHGNLRLQSGSPCTDMGSNAAVTTSTDLAGNTRIVNGTVDMGAYEFAPPLTVKSGTYLYNSARPTVEMVFSGPLLAGSVISPGSLILTNNTTGATIDTTFHAEAIYNPGVYTADWLYDSILPDGNYTAKIQAGSVKDASGNPLPADFSFNFFSLSGDANHDRTVNALDFNALATNYGKAATFSQGDFDYSGTVDSNDFAMLASRFGTHLSPQSGADVPDAMPAASRSHESLFSDVFVTNPTPDQDPVSVLTD